MSASARGSAPLLEVRGLDLFAPGGRRLIQNLTLRVGREQAAIIGRNGVGKSSLLRLLVGEDRPARGSVVRRTTPWLVPQNLVEARPMVRNDPFWTQSGATRRHAVAVELSRVGLPPAETWDGRSACSPGELRKLRLLEAKLRRPEFLILDEPTEDLDEAGIAWLVDWLEHWQGGLIVVSHQRQLLALFRDFLVIAESGCLHFAGGLEELDAALEKDEANNQQRYLRRLNTLVQQEAHSEKYRRRRERKKNVGRVRELGRATPRMRLNQKRSYAQEKQGRIEAVRRSRLDAARNWAKAARRALAVALPLEAVMPELPPHNGQPVIDLREVGAEVDGTPLFRNINLSVGRERIAVIGPNGAGKTTLLRIMTGDVVPSAGRASGRLDRIGTLAQGGANWISEDSLLERLSWMSGVSSLQLAADLLIAHGFPLALAERPLSSLSPGERVRAALICLFQRRPAIEVLILDEPTHALDFVGAGALAKVLRTWRGGLVVASHDRQFLDAVGVEQVIELPRRGRPHMQ